MRIFYKYIFLAVWTICAVFCPAAAAENKTDVLEDVFYIESISKEKIVCTLSDQYYETGWVYHIYERMQEENKTFLAENYIDSVYLSGIEKNTAVFSYYGPDTWKQTKPQMILIPVGRKSVSPGVSHGLVPTNIYDELNILSPEEQFSIFETFLSVDTQARLMLKTNLLMNLIWFGIIFDPVIHKGIGVHLAYNITEVAFAFLSIPLMLFYDFTALQRILIGTLPFMLNVGAQILYNNSIIPAEKNTQSMTASQMNSMSVYGIIDYTLQPFYFGLHHTPILRDISINLHLLIGFTPGSIPVLPGISIQYRFFNVPITTKKIEFFSKRL